MPSLADPPAGLNLQPAGRDHPPDQLRLRRPPLLGPIQIDNVHPLRPRFGKRPGRLDRIDVVVDLPRVIPLPQPHHPAGAKINARNNHQCHLAQFSFATADNSANVH
jgi:hypothetical protein